VPDFTLRQLPLPAKWVLTAFLFSVGIGYFSALVQLHLQHSSRDGEPLPTPGDVVEIFAGKKKPEPGAATGTVSKFEKLVNGPLDGPWNGSGSMAAAFFHKDDGTYKRAIKDEPAAKDQLDAERKGEQAAVTAWLKLEPAARKEAYAKDAGPVPPGAITPDYRTEKMDAIKVASIITDRCARCHVKGGDQGDYPLETYEQIEKYLAVPKSVMPDAQGFVPSERQTSIEKLTQSTHAHLLSFSVLFTLTGLVFAFSSYPVWMRCLLSPIVLIAQVCDIACWWLARTEPYGHLFAQAIIGTGGIVGMGLAAQIVLGTLNLYGTKGKAVIVLFLLLGGAGFGVLFNSAIAPALAAEKKS
jgi:hypothetical protein